MAVIALFAEGKTRLYDIEHARVKESDRISDLRKELLKVGANVKETKKELIITPKKIYKNDCTLNPHNDSWGYVVHADSLSLLTHSELTHFP